jgi:hypothetical protein
MNRKKSCLFCLYSVLVITFLIIINSCVTSALKSVWNDSTYKGGPFKKILVIGVDRNPNLRRMLENRFAGQLTAKGTPAISSYTLFGEDEILDREMIVRKIHELGIDSVLVTTVVDVKDVGMYDTYPAQVNSGFYDYYVLCCGSTVSEGYVALIETKLFDAKYDKLIWSAMSESAFISSFENSISSFVSIFLKDLHDKKLLP